MLGISKSFAITLFIAGLLWWTTKQFNNFLVIVIGYIIVKVVWNFFTK
jgi:hypothetical protein